MSAIKPIRRNDASIYDTSRQTAAGLNKRSNAEGRLNFEDVLAEVTGNYNDSVARKHSARGIDISLPIIQPKTDITLHRANAAYIRAGAESHALGEQYKVPVSPAVYDFVSH